MPKTREQKLAADFKSSLLHLNLHVSSLFKKTLGDKGRKKTKHAQHISDCTSETLMRRHMQKSELALLPAGGC